MEKNRLKQDQQPPQHTSKIEVHIVGSGDPTKDAEKLQLAVEIASNFARVARECFEAARQVQPDAGDRLCDEMNMLLSPGPILMSPVVNETVFRSHCNELIARFIVGEDTRPGTLAEVTNLALDALHRETSVRDDLLARFPEHVRSRDKKTVNQMILLNLMLSIDAIKSDDSNIPEHVAELLKEVQTPEFADAMTHVVERARRSASQSWRVRGVTDDQLKAAVIQEVKEMNKRRRREGGQ